MEYQGFIIETNGKLFRARAKTRYRRFLGIDGRELVFLQSSAATMDYLPALKSLIDDYWATMRKNSNDWREYKEGEPV